MSFPNLICWWEKLVKPNVRKFYILQGKEYKKLQCGLVTYLEAQLRKQYEIVYKTGITNYNEIQSIKMEIESHRQEKVVGVEIRSRVQDSLSNEKISKYLIAKHKEISQNKIVHTMTDNNGLELTTFAEIQTHATDFYKNFILRKRL